MDGTWIAKLNIAELGAPVMSLSSPIEWPVQEMTTEAVCLRVTMRPFDRLVVRVTSLAGAPLFACVSPPMRRVGPHGFGMGVTWGQDGCTMLIAGVVASSSKDGPIPEVIEIGGGKPQVSAVDWQERSLGARKNRRFRGERLLAEDPAAAYRLVSAVSQRTANLRDALDAVRNGRLARMLDLGANLRALVADGDGNALLRRVAGLVDAPLDLYCPSPRERKDVATTFPQAPFSAQPLVSVRETPGCSMRVDLDVWLRFRSWTADGRGYTNEEALRKFGDTEASHTDDVEHPLMRWMRSATGPHPGADTTILVGWLIAVAEAVVTLVEREVLPRTAALHL